MRQNARSPLKRGDGLAGNERDESKANAVLGIGGIDVAGILEGAEPFLHKGGDRGVLLVHGFTGAPAEMALLGEFLHAAGYTVLAPRLCGHGTSPQEMAATDWEKWYHSACDGYHLLKHLCSEIHAIGLSMGALLAMRLAHEFEAVRSVVSMSAPIYIANPNLKYLPPPEKSVGKFVRKSRRKLSGVPERYAVAYRQMPLVCIHGLITLISETMEVLPALRKPLLVVQSRADHTVLPDSASYIYRSAGSSEKELFWLEVSGHLVTLDCEREKVFAKIAAFLAAGDKTALSGQR